MALMPRRVGRLGLWLLGLLFAAWLLHRGAQGLDAAALSQRAGALPAGVWLLAALGVLASHGLRAVRLQAEWRSRTGARFIECLQLVLLHNAAVLLLPLRSGEAGYAWWLHRRWGVPLAASLPSLLWLRLQDLLLLAGLAGVLLMPPGWAAGAVLSTAALGPVLWRRLQATVRVRLGAGARAVDVTGPMRRGTQRIGRGVCEALLAGRGGRTAWICATANWGLRLSVVAVLLGLLAPLAPRQAARGALAGEWVAVLPVQGPAGLGTYEAGVWLGTQLDASDMPAPAATTAAATASASAAERLPALAPAPISASIPASAGLADVGGAALLVHLLWLAVSLGAALPAALCHRSAITAPDPTATAPSRGA